VTVLTVMSQNVQYGALEAGRLPGLYEAVRHVNPGLLLLQEASDLTDPDVQRNAEAAMGLKIKLAPSKHLAVAVAWNPAVLREVGFETTYCDEMHHGYVAARLEPAALDDPLPAPIVAISTHFSPFSAETAASGRGRDPLPRVRRSTCAAAHAPRPRSCGLCFSSCVPGSTTRTTPRPAA
jgi:hypothetical protein